MHRSLRLIGNLIVPVTCLSLGLCLLLVSGTTSFAQRRRGGSRPTVNRSAPNRARQSPTPTPSPTPAPTALPTASATPPASPTATSSPSVSPTPTPMPCTTRFGYGDAFIEGPPWLVLTIALFVIAAPFLMLLLRSRIKSGASESKTNRWWWVIGIVYVVLGLLLLVWWFRGTPQGELVSSRSVTAELTPCPTPTPTPTPRPTDPGNKGTGKQASPTPPPAQSPTPTPNTSPTPTPTPTPIPTPFPLSISSVKLSDAKEAVAGLGDTIIVSVKNLDNEIKREQSLPPETERIDPRKYVLFLDNMEIKKLYPIAFDPGTNSLSFKLARPVESKEAWANLLAAQTSSTRLARASVGPEGKLPLPNGQTFNLRIYNPFLLRLGFLLFLAAVAGFIVLAWKKPILRDSEPAQPVGGSLSRPFSLALTQVAWWTFIILGSFLFIAFVTWDFDTITTSSLVLLGIGTGTALGSRMVDKSKRDATNAELRVLEPQKAGLEAAISELEKKIQGVEARLKPAPNTEVSTPSQEELSALPLWRTELATKRAELKMVTKQLVDAQSHQEKPITDGFFADLLTDANGYTFHRLQVVVWTVVLGIIFLWSVWRTLSMPEFSETVLALMGISAGTYLGFKIPERQTAPSDAPAQPASPAEPTPPVTPTSTPEQPNTVDDSNMRG